MSKLSDDSFEEYKNAWRVCAYCGWFALRSVPGRIYALEPGDPCKYGCGDTMVTPSRDDYERYLSMLPSSGQGR